MAMGPGGRALSPLRAQEAAAFSGLSFPLCFRDCQRNSLTFSSVEIKDEEHLLRWYVNSFVPPKMTQQKNNTDDPGK